VDQKKARETSRTSLDRKVTEIGLPVRATEALEKAGLGNVGQVIAKLGEGEAAILAIDGFWSKVPH